MNRTIVRLPVLLFFVAQGCERPAQMPTETAAPKEIDEGVSSELRTIAESPETVSGRADAFSNKLSRVHPESPEWPKVIATLRELDVAGNKIVGTAVLSLYGSEPCRWAAVKRAVPSLDEIEVPCRPFIPQADIERRVAEIISVEDEQQKQSLTSALLAEIRNAQTLSENSTVHDVVKRLIAAYRSTRSVGILNAMNAVHIDGGVGNTLCGFYRALREDQEYVRLVQQDVTAAAAASRCLGGKVPGQR